MKSKLLNVRLDEQRLRKVRRLRASGVTLAHVVREAIDLRYDALDTPLTARQTAGAVATIHRQYPDPAGQPSRPYDVHDRQAARAAIVRALTRRPR